MTTSSRIARLRFSVFALLFAGAASALTLLPQDAVERSAAMAGDGEFDVCTGSLFSGDTSIAGAASPGYPAAYPQPETPEFACAGDGCIDLASISSQPSAGQNEEDDLPEIDEPIPVFVSFADMPILPGDSGPATTDEPPGSPEAAQAGASDGNDGGKEGGGNEGGSNQGGGNGGGEQFVLLPGTNGLTIPGGPNSGANGGGTPSSGSVESGNGGGSGGGTGGGGTGGGGTGGGGMGGGGSEDGTSDNGEVPVVAFAAVSDPVTDVPAPATAVLLGIALAVLAGGQRRQG